MFSHLLIYYCTKVINQEVIAFHGDNLLVIFCVNENLFPLFNMNAAKNKVGQLPKRYTKKSQKRVQAYEKCFRYISVKQ